jgi:hypothetical protein
MSRGGYTVLGLSDAGNVELTGLDSICECQAWIDGYTRHNDWGGYYGLALIGPDGDYLEIFDAPEKDDEV